MTKTNPHQMSKKFTFANGYLFTFDVSHIMSGSCHLDRASNVEIGVECQIFVIVITDLF